MWDFLGRILQEGGVVAALFFIVLFFFGGTVRTLWAQNQELHKRLENLQEKRLNDALKMQESMFKHIASVDEAMSRLSSSLDVLIKLTGNGKD